MEDNSKTAGPAPAPVITARRFAAQAEAAIVDLEERFSSGIGPAEQTLAEGIRAAAARLLECAEQVANDGLMVVGSTGQQRPHPLLKVEKELRHEIGDGLQRLVFRGEQGALFEEAKALTRKRGERS